jgi:hypothetical protein
MKKMMTAFASEAWGRTVDSVFALTAEPRRRAAVGIECGSSTNSAGSVFIYTPKAIALSLLGRTGLGITPAPIGENSFLQAWQDLFKVEPFHVETAENRSTVRLDENRKMRAKTLSSNQLFLGIISSPRPFQLITAQARMSEALSPNLAHIEQRLLQMHSNRYLRVRELEIRVRAIAPSIQGPPPEGRTRQDLLQWLSKHGTVAEDLIARMAMGY